MVDARRGRPASGLAWGDGHVLTSAHVLEREDEISVDAGDGPVSASLAGYDPATDIALLKVDGLKAPAAKRGDSSTLKPGSLVLAVGRPGRLQASLGMVAGLEAGGGRGMAAGRLIVSDATLYQGFSGGPLLDASGQVVGINSWFYGRGSTRSLPVEEAARVAEQLRLHGRVAQPYLGIGTQPLHLDEPAKAVAGQESGLLVVSVDAAGPAAAAGLRQGDILVGVGGTATGRVRELVAALRGAGVGSVVALRVLRGDAVAELSATVAERAAEAE